MQQILIEINKLLFTKLNEMQMNNVEDIVNKTINIYTERYEPHKRLRLQQETPHPR